MTRWRAGALPVLWQTLILLVAAVIVAQAVGIALLFWLPPPRPDFNRLGDISAALLNEERETEGRDVALVARLQPGPPAVPAGLTEDTALTSELAARVGAPASLVKLAYEPEQQRVFFPFTSPRRPRGSRKREPMFFGRLQAAVATPQGWRVAETPPPPLVAPWQRRMILWFAASALALVPLAWIFARRISRPIRRFAGAADRLRADPSAPAVPEEGPAELRIAASALNRMQARLATHVGERTAMIGAIAHDLRTPLARIAFRVENAPEPVRDKVLGDVEQMRAMIAATIGFVRTTGQAEAHVPIDLAALLAALASQDRDLGRKVAMRDSGALMVLGDSLALERLFQNLIDNGLAYGRSVEIALAGAPGKAVATIADRGPGLPEAALERMFQPFERGEPSRNRDTGGIGLGLTIARAIAEEHGGTVRLANRAEGGLEAIVTLPLAA